jgi:hypothetical protein
MRYSAHLESTKRLAAALQLLQLEQTRWITILCAKLEIPMVAEIRRVGHRRGHDVSDEVCKGLDVDWPWSKVRRRGPLAREHSRSTLQNALCRRAGIKSSKGEWRRGCSWWPSQTRTGTTGRIASIGTLAFCIELSSLICSGQMRLSQPLISPGDKVCILAGGQNAVYPSRGRRGQILSRRSSLGRRHHG